MKAGICILAVLFVFTVAAHGQNGRKSKSRVIINPPHFTKAEAFLEMSADDRVTYASGLMDGFYASALFGASDETVARLASCSKDMDSKQISAIILKYVKDDPESWHLALSFEAFKALIAICPAVGKSIP